jgi:Fe-S cluster biogenesis protein NfuA
VPTSPPPQNLRAVGDRIERLLDELDACADPKPRAIAEELIRQVTDLYGAGLARMLQLAGDLSSTLVEQLSADELIGSLLVMHGLHSESLETRVERALEAVRPILGAHKGDVELVDIDVAANAVKLRLLGSCDGCPSSTITLQMAVERAILEAAPEIAIIDVEQPSTKGASTPVFLTAKPEYTDPIYTECPAEIAG